MVSSMKLNPQDHGALESGLTTLHVTRLGPKKFIKWSRIEGFIGPVLRPALGRV